MRTKPTDNNSYVTQFSYLKKSPLFLLWWPSFCYFIPIIILLYPLAVPSDYLTKCLSMIFIVGLLYLVQQNANKNYYLVRTALSIKILNSELLIETLRGQHKIKLPLIVHEVDNKTRNKLLTTFPLETKLLEAQSKEDSIYLTSMMESFDEFSAKAGLQQIRDCEVVGSE